jgi:hypothetical protein
MVPIHLPHPALKATAGATLEADSGDDHGADEGRYWRTVTNLGQ